MAEIKKYSCDALDNRMDRFIAIYGDMKTRSVFSEILWLS